MKNSTPLIPRALALLLFWLLLSPLQAIPVWINELHYDNDGSDTGEFIEVAGGSGQDLSGFTLLLYNGYNGSVYGSHSLSGTLPNSEGGFGVLSYFISGIQNGSPDGVALIDASNAVLQFLSYEGSFLATNGAASGLTSSDIGQSESSTTPVGHSLQLAGFGSDYADFHWASASSNTAGAVNGSQSFGYPAAESGSTGLLLLLGVSGFLYLQRIVSRNDSPRHAPFQ